jgi:hypothetical protein
LLIGFPVLAVLVGCIAAIVFLYVKTTPARKLAVDNPLVTMKNFDKLKPGQALAEAEAWLGESDPVKGTDVEEAYADGAVASAAIMGLHGRGLHVDRNEPRDSIRSMVRNFSVVSWVRWRNKTANIYAGLKKADDGTQLAVIGFLDYDVQARNYSADWKVLPVNVEISNSGSGQREPGDLNEPR